ncbi:hypothetical protein T03_8946, partial [Trichinella britovi]
MLVTADCFIMQIGWIFVLCFSFPRYSVATSKCHDLNEFTMLSLTLYRVVVYKAPARNIGKALIAGGNANAWQNTPDLTGLNGHTVVKSLEHVIMADNTNKFIAYNNIPPDIPKVKTKSNSK